MTRNKSIYTHERAERIVATWPGAHRYLMTSAQRLKAVREVEAFLLGETDAFGDAAHALLELSSSEVLPSSRQVSAGRNALRR